MTEQMIAVPKALVERALVDIARLGAAGHEAATTALSIAYNTHQVNPREAVRSAWFEGQSAGYEEATEDRLSDWVGTGPTWKNPYVDAPQEPTVGHYEGDTFVPHYPGEPWVSLAKRTALQEDRDE